MSVLVDTPVWSLALRRKGRDLNAAEAAIVAELRMLIQEGRARMIGMVRQELLSGIKSQGQYEKLRGILQAFPDVPTGTAEHEAGARAGNECRARGVAVSGSDMLICAVALIHDWPIFTVDSDFKNYARVLPIRLHTPRK